MPDMNQETLNMLTDTLGKAVSEVCCMMLGENVTVGDARLESGRPPILGSIVRGTISISGDVSGEATIHLPTPTAVNLVSAFVGMPIEAEDEAFEDAIGELANMVVGSAKAHFEGMSCSISCPQVVHLTEMSPDVLKRTPELWLPVTGQSGDFAIEVMLAA